MTSERTEKGTAGPVFLVVDDDAMVRKIVTRGLAALNPEEVLEVQDGVEAQQVLREQAVDVVITDVLMPNMSGLQLMKWAQENCPEPLWIVLSGLETFDTAVDALQLGAFDYLSKPPEVHRVRVAVRNALDQIELVRERQRLYEQIEQSNVLLAEKVEQLEQVRCKLEEQAAVIQSDLDRAEQIQSALLPQKPPDMDGWCLETLYRAGSSVGGDFYDVILLDEQHVGLVISDASGHGVAAAMLSVLFKLRLNLVDEEGKVLMPGQVLSGLNRRLHDTISAPGAFTTSIYVLLNQHTGKARIASAGHPPCIHTTAAGQANLIERTGPALGLDEDAQYEEREIELNRGDRLLLYTDGVLGCGEQAVTSGDIINTLYADIDRVEVPGALYRAATQDEDAERDDITLILIERGDGVSHFDDVPSAEERQQAKPSPSQEAGILEGAEDGKAFIRLSGTVNWIFSQAFLDAANTLLTRYATLTIDLESCVYLDSTCLGTLHEIVMSHSDTVTLQNMPAGIRDLFNELSMEAVLCHVRTDATPLPSNMQPIKKTQIDMVRQGERMLSAHETLASLSEENREKFQDVVDSLHQDLGQGE